jgi:hypothetical protein
MRLDVVLIELIVMQKLRFELQMEYRILLHPSQVWENTRRSIDETGDSTVDMNMLQAKSAIITTLSTCWVVGGRRHCGWTAER